MQYYTESMFLSDEDETIKRLKEGSAIFLKYWNIDEEPTFYPYLKKKLPGLRTGASSSVIGGNNVGISIFSNKRKSNSVASVLKYITSRDIQKKHVMNYAMHSGIPSIYKDEDVKEKMKGRISDNLQYIGRPIFKRKNYDKYSQHYRRILYDYLYERKDISITETLHQLNDLSKIFHISIEYNNDSHVGLIFGIVIIILSIFMLLSLRFHYLIQFQRTFMFIHYLSWILIIVGSVLLLNISFFEYGIITTTKCHLKFFLLLLGYNFVYISVLWELLGNLLVKNKILTFISNNKQIFIFPLVVIELVLGLISFLLPNSVELVDNDSMNKMYQRCIINNGMFSYISQRMSLVFIIIIQLFISVILFTNWKAINLKNERIYLCLGAFASFLFVIAYVIIESVDTENYVLYGVLRIIDYMFLSISNYVNFYIIRIIIGYKEMGKNPDTEYSDVIGIILKNDKKIKDMDKEYNQVIKSSNVKDDDVSSIEIPDDDEKRQSFFKRLCNYHYKKDRREKMDFVKHNVNVNTFCSTENSSISCEQNTTISRKTTVI